MNCLNVWQQIKHLNSVISLCVTSFVSAFQSLQSTCTKKVISDLIHLNIHLYLDTDKNKNVVKEMCKSLCLGSNRGLKERLRKGEFRWELINVYTSTLAPWTLGLNDDVTIFSLCLTSLPPSQCAVYSPESGCCQVIRVIKTSSTWGSQAFLNSIYTACTDHLSYYKILDQKSGSRFIKIIYIYILYIIQ